LNLVELLRAVGGRHNKSPGEVAIAWVLRHPAVTAAIVGARKPGQLKELVGAAEWRLTADEVNEIGSFLSTNAG
jgi:aryl-alcohol dehydrogenase-like predicted oxidoreductase